MTEFQKELSSTLLYPFLKPGVNVGKHAHKSSWINYTRSSLICSGEGFGATHNARFSCGISIRTEKNTLDCLGR